MTALLPARTFACSTGEGAVYHHGAHVVDWTPSGGEPVLWMGQMSSLDSETPIRGGVPICWPWFGAGPDGVATPLHGFSRLTEWRLVQTEATDDAVVATYLLINACPEKFEFRHRLTYTVSFGREFSATLTVRNTGTRRFTFEEALHTYLKVGDVRQITITGLEGAKYLDRVSGHDVGPHTQVGSVVFSEETDRIYHSTSEIEVVDPILSRRIIMKRKGSKDAVVWNPWAERSDGFPDFGDNEWTGMVCVETANVGEHAVTLNPGKEHSMGFTLRVAPQ